MMELYNGTGGHLTCPHPLQKKKKNGEVMYCVKRHQEIVREEMRLKILKHRFAARI